jgi:hypothetical protein
MSDFKPRRCRECGEGMVRPLAKAGRRMPYRNLAALPVPVTLTIPTCDKCGNEWIDPKTAHAIDEALESAYVHELHKRLVAAVDTIVSEADVSQRRLEQLLGLSPGYLSRVRNGRGDASAQLVSALALIAEDPKRRIKELDHVWQPDA